MRVVSPGLLQRSAAALQSSSVRARACASVVLNASGASARARRRTSLSSGHSSGLTVRTSTVMSLVCIVILFKPDA